MADFNPEPYFQAFQAGQQRKNNLVDALSSLPQYALKGMDEGQQMRHQKLMDQLAQAQGNRTQSDWDLQNKSLVPPSQSSDAPYTSDYSPSQNPNIPSFGGLPNNSAPSGMSQPQPSPMFGNKVSPTIQAWKSLPSNHPYGPSQTGPSSNPEQPYLDILHNPSESPMRQKMASEAIGRITEEEKTPYEKQGWQLGLDKTKAETAKFGAEASKATAEANMLNSPGGGFKVQNQLEQQGRDLATKIINSRSGDFGVQNQKVSQAIHLRSLLDQYKQVDPRTGQTTYNVPNSQYSELAVGLANLLSNGGQASESTINSIRQSSAQGDLNNALTYAGFDPRLLGGSTQGILKNLSDSIDRQGLVSQKLREPVLNQIRQQMPTMLNPDVKERIINSLGVNRYEDYMNGGQGPGTTQGIGQGGGVQQIGRFKVVAH